MRHFKLVIFTTLFLLSTITHAETDDISNKNEGLGFGIGAIIGDLIAGSPGAVIGATGGSLFGNNKTKMMLTRPWKNSCNKKIMSLHHSRMNW